MIPTPPRARSPRRPRARLAVLMATRDGAAWLGAQLGSIAAQTRAPDLMLVSDDGSTDATPALLDAFAAAYPGLGLRRLAGPGQGAAANFLSLIARAPGDVDRLSFADQDDVWLPGKLARAGAALDAAEAEDGAAVPLLYCARILVCDAGLGRRRASRPLRRPASFRNALTQNVATGNTVVLNRAATDLVRRAAARTGAAVPVVHDWWLYQIVTGAGGRLLHDPEPQVLYRQHGGNLIGAGAGQMARARRMGQLLSGVHRGWTDANLAALAAAGDLLTPANAALIRDLAAARAQGPLARVRAIGRLGLYRQGRGAQAALYAAAALGRF